MLDHGRGAAVPYLRVSIGIVFCVVDGSVRRCEQIVPHYGRHGVPSPVLYFTECVASCPLGHDGTTDMHRVTALELCPPAQDWLGKSWRGQTGSFFVWRFEGDLGNNVQVERVVNLPPVPVQNFG